MKPELLRETENPILRPPDEIRRAFEDMGVKVGPSLQTTERCLRVLDMRKAAGALGIPYRRLRRFLSGRLNDMHLLYALAAALHCSMDDLYWVVRARPIGSDKLHPSERMGRSPIRHLKGQSNDSLLS